MVTGQAPFSGDSPVAIAYKHVKEYPALPSSLNPAVPADFEAIVMKAMAKDPDDRYQSAAELRDDLVRFHQGQPVAAPPPVAGTLRPRAVAGPPALLHPGTTRLRPAGHRLVGQTGPTYALTAPRGPAPGRAGGPPCSSSSWSCSALLVFFIGQNAGWWGTPATINALP